MPSPPPPPPSLLTLPPELRHKIYALLSPPKPLSYPFGLSPISHITHSRLPTTLQRTCAFLCSEIIAWFYGTATVKCVPLADTRIQDTHIDALVDAQARGVLQRMQRVEIFVQGVDARWKARFGAWLGDLVEVLVRDTAKVRFVTVSLGSWGLEGTLLSAGDVLGVLAGLAGRLRGVEWRAGYVVAHRGEEGAVKEVLEGWVRVLNGVACRG
ncbi:hypothetical protein IQ07DRAFT_643825 [Pyrenochaeta sp. DS3sAY3a]|nr:hypothetical protein IQ07DRAFT_643825 [Pyrenochaeta sp. DS3sAY3a]